jgi:hypothetical protein
MRGSDTEAAEGKGKIIRGFVGIIGVSLILGAIPLFLNFKTVITSDNQSITYSGESLGVADRTKTAAEITRLLSARQLAPLPGVFGFYWNSILFYTWTAAIIVFVLVVLWGLIEYSPSPKRR